MFAFDSFCLNCFSPKWHTPLPSIENVNSSLESFTSITKIPKSLDLVLC